MNNYTALFLLLKLGQCSSNANRSK